MNKTSNIFWPVSIASALLFQAIFYGLNPGLNYALYSVSILSILFFYLKPGSYSSIFKLLLTLFMVCTVAVVFAHTQYSFFIYWIFALTLIACAGYTQMKHIQLAPLLALNCLENLLRTNQNKEPVKTGGRAGAFLKFIFLPLVTILLLMWMYAASNQLFADSVSWLTDLISDLFKKISIPRFFFTLLGFVITAIFLSGAASPQTISMDNKMTNPLVRFRNGVRKVTGLSKLLLRKKQVAIIAFIILNLMLGWLNYLDIKFIWIDFNWDGGFLKDMVHEGTHTLIFAIIISIAITLFYLNSNLVFLKNNRFFNALLILWLLQNTLMAASVVMRNNIYIEHFGLAYKRIFVYFFLLACVTGLVSIIYKIVYRKSIHFVVSINSISVVLILAASACFNWDRIIAYHNFSHYRQSFVHYRFLMDLNNSALPLLMKTPDKLNDIHRVQSRKFSFIKEKEFETTGYLDKIAKRRLVFIKQWGKKSLLEWNYAEYRAFRALTPDPSPKGSGE